MSTDKRNLLPLGTRVKHTNPDLAKCFGNTEGTLVAYFVTGLGATPGENVISDSFPYRVRFDTPTGADLRDVYPLGYEAIFAERNIEAVSPAANVFPDDDALIVGRMWLRDLKKWSSWQVFSQTQYHEFRKQPSDHHFWEFCFRDPVTEPA